MWACTGPGEEPQVSAEATRQPLDLGQYLQLQGQWGFVSFAELECVSQNSLLCLVPGELWPQEHLA